MLEGRALTSSKLQNAYTFRMFTYIGERSMYGMKLVNMCHGSKDRRLEDIYTEPDIWLIASCYEWLELTSVGRDETE